MEAALKGIYDALDRLRGEVDGGAYARCDEVVAICCHQLASVYEKDPIDVIRWLRNPECDSVPESVGEFVKKHARLRKTLEWHDFKQTLQRTGTDEPQDAIVANNPLTQIPPEDSDSDESAELQEEILVHGFDAPDKSSIPESDINRPPERKSDNNGDALLLTSDFDIQQPRVPSSQALAQRGCEIDHGPWLIGSVQQTEKCGPARLDTNQNKMLQSYEEFLAPAPTLYSLSNKTRAISGQLPSIGASKSISSGYPQSTPPSAQSYHKYLDDSNIWAERTSLPSYGFQKRELAEWAVVSGGSHVSSKPLWPSTVVQLPPLQNIHGKSQSPNHHPLPYMWKRTPPSKAVPPLPTKDRLQPNPVRQRYRYRNHPRERNALPPRPKSSKSNSTLNILAEKSWPRPLPRELVANLARTHTQCTKSWMTSFGQNIASYRSGELYHCPFDDEGHSSSFNFLRHLVDEHSGSRLLKSYDPDNRLILVSRLKPQGRVPFELGS